MGRLEGKVAVITGAAGDIGSCASRLFVKESAKVVLADLDKAAVTQLEQELGAANSAAVVADVTSAEDNEAMIRAAERKFGGLDIFLANAGIEGQASAIAEIDDNDFDRVMAINVKGCLLGLQAAIPAIARRGGGSIVITSSGCGVHGTANLGSYTASKHAVIGLMRTAALECAPMNIRVNAVCPAPVNSRMMERVEQGVAPGEGDTVRDAVMKTMPFGRYAEPDEVAKVMLFLASDDSSFVSGALQMVDGAETA